MMIGDRGTVRRGFGEHGNADNYGHRYEQNNTKHKTVRTCARAFSLAFFLLQMNDR